jgi:hypothetical protein
MIAASSATSVISSRAFVAFSTGSAEPLPVATTRVNPGRKSDNAAKAEGDAAKAA